MTSVSKVKSISYQINCQEGNNNVAIARAIINDPKFIIADEPTGALDSKTSQDIMELFVKLNKEQNTTIIMVTHDREVAEKADRIIHILDGRVQEEEVLTRE